MPKGNGCNANAHPKTAEFMRDLMELCKKHNMVVVPMSDGEVSFHDSMVVIPMEGMDYPTTEAIAEYVGWTLVYPDDFEA